MEIEQEKNFNRISSKSKKEQFKKRFKRIRCMTKQDDYNDKILSFNSGNIATDQAQFGSVNPNLDPINTEQSKDCSKKVPSVSHSRPPTGRGVNGLNTGSTNKNRFDFTSRVGDGNDFEEMQLFQERSQQQDMRFSGGGSSHNGLINSITYDPFNFSDRMCTPQGNLGGMEKEELGVNTLENPGKKRFFYPKDGVKSERKKEEKKHSKFFADVPTITEKSESRYTKTINEKTSEKIVQELSAKISEKSKSKNSKSIDAKKKGKKLNLKLNKINILGKKNKNGDIDGVKTSKPYFNVCLLYTSPSPRDLSTSRMPSSA